jgi:TRAP-type C4-dicarboxylate transport system permease small subunit
MTMKRTADALASMLAIIAGLSLVLMMVHVSLDVVLKYFFKLPIPGTAEVVASYYMIGTVFLPLAYIEVHNRPIVVELFYDRMPSGLQLPLDILGTAASIAFYAFLAWQSTKIAITSFETREYVDGIWKVIVWPSRFLIPVGLIVACVVLVLRLQMLLRGGRAQHGRAEPI